MVDSATDITLGEVWRGLQALQTAVTSLSASVTAMRSDLLREIETQITDRQQALVDRVTRLERFVYGAVALVMSAVGVSVLALVLK